MKAFESKPVNQQRESAKTTPATAEFSAPAASFLGDALAMQREAACACGGGCPRCGDLGQVQPKLAISTPGDRYEQEADRVADNVMRASGSAAQPAPAQSLASGLSRVQRQNRDAPQTSRPVAEPGLQPETASETSSASHLPMDLVPGCGQTLPETALGFFGSKFGCDFSGVRIHTGAKAEQTAEAIHAHAYTIGRDIVFGAGHYAPETTAGQRLLAHELTHTIQQGNGAMREPSEQKLETVEPDPAADPAMTVSLRSAPQISRFWPFDSEKDIAFKGPDSEIAYRLGKDDPKEDTKAYEVLNGMDIPGILSTVNKLKARGLLGKLVSQFTHATTVSRPRIWACMMAVQYDGQRTAADMEGILKDDFATMRAHQESDQVDEILAYSKLHEPVITANPAAVANADAAPASAEAPAANDKAATTADPQKLVAFSLSNNPVKIASDSDEKKTLKVEESPAVYVRAVLKNAGIDYDKFFSEFTFIKFFGCSVTPQIHKDFAANLKKIEQDNLNGKTPEEAGKLFGIKLVGGSRDYPTSAAFSMHLVGMAVDINYTESPFISSSVSDTFARAGLLIDGTAYSYDGKRHDYDFFAPINEAIKAYFALLDDDAKLTEKLASASKAKWPGTKALATSWENATLDLAKKQIKADLASSASRWERTQDQVKANGFLGVSKKLVEIMTKDNANSWGGGEYGDIMHFDMRTKGLGAKINAGFSKYKTEKEKESKDKYQAETQDERKARQDAAAAAAAAKKKPKK